MGKISRRAPTTITNVFISTSAAKKCFILNAFCFPGSGRLNNYVTFVKDTFATIPQSLEGQVCVLNFSGLKADYVASP